MGPHPDGQPMMKLALSLALSMLLAACASSDAPKPAALSKLPPMPQPADNLPTPAAAR
jgi:hypothetical protein